MPISERKLAANRANARRSTGPRTAAGKRKVSRNAVVHGLTARSALIHGDDEEEFERLARRTFDELQPDGVVQEQLVAEIVNHTWKLRRVPRAETLLFNEHHRRRKLPPTDDDHLMALESYLRPLSGMPHRKDVWVDLEPSAALCHMIERKYYSSGPPDSPVWLLERYAIRLERARASALRMLLALQKRQARDEEEDGVDDDGVDHDVVDHDGVDHDGVDDDDSAVDDASPVAAPAPLETPLAVSQTEARADEIAHPSAKPQADVEAPPDTGTASADVTEQNSTVQNKPTEVSSDAGPEVAASNRDAIRTSSENRPARRRKQSQGRPGADAADPVEPDASIGESPPATT
jgi:hypothetical protein